MNIVTKFDVGQLVFWVNSIFYNSFTFSKGMVTEIVITTKGDIFYKIEYECYGQIREEGKYEKDLYPSFESMEAPILRKRRNDLKKLLDDTEKEIAEYEKKGI